METIGLWLADLRELAEREERALFLLPDARRAAAERYRRREDRLHCAAAGLLLRRVLGVDSDEKLRRNGYGKPELAFGGPCFNLSHGGNYAVLAVFHRPVGVDVEPVGERMPAVLPRRALLSEELTWLEEEPTPERFAALWTRLESALKADGRGLALEKREFSVVDSGRPWHLTTFSWDGHMISCAAGEEFDIKLTRVPAEQLLE